MKKLLIVIVIAVVVVFAGLTALVLLVNPNQFKPLIVEQTKKATGLDLVIEGDIRWQFFPSLGFTIGKTEMRNPDGFEKENLFQVNAVDVSVAIMPLFDKQLKIGRVSLNGAAIQLETLKDGRTNLDSLTASQHPANDENGHTADRANQRDSKRVDDSQSEPVWTINLAGIAVNDSNLDIINRKTNTSTTLHVSNLSVSEFTPGEWSQASFDVEGSRNHQRFTANGSAEFNLSEDFQNYALRDVLLDATFDDATNKIDSARLTIDSFALDKPALVKLSVNGVVANMKLAMTGQTQLLVDNGFKTISASQLMMNADLKGDALPSSPMKVSLDSDVTFNLEKSILKAALKKFVANDIALDGSSTVTLADIPKIRFDLHSNNIDVDKFLGLDSAAKGQSVKTNTGSTQNTQVSSASVNQQSESEPDLSALKTLDLAGRLSIDKLKASHVEMTNMVTKIAVNRGIATLDSFNANLYQGSVSARGELDARKTPATYSIKKTVSGVKVGPLLVAAADTDILEGTGNIVANLTGKGLAPKAMMQNLAGTVEVNFADGAVNGLNVAQMIRTTYAKIKGKALSTEESVKKTDFSALTATLTLANGIVSTDNLHMQSPLLRIKGKGKANYVKQTINFWLDTAVVGSLEGQGGKDVEDLKDVTIPIEIKGDWADPNIDIALDVVFKKRAHKKIDKEATKLKDKLDSKIKDEKTKEAVNKLLKGLFYLWGNALKVQRLAFASLSRW